MKKLIISVISLIMALFCVSCSDKQEESSVPDGMKLASSEEAASYALYVPEDWTVDMATAATRAHCSKSDASSVSAMAWELEHTDSKIEDWWDVNVEELKTVFADYNEEAVEQTTLDGRQAVKYVYTASLGENKFKFMQTAALNGSGAVYIITYTALEDVYDSHADEVYSILENFKFN